MKKLNGWWVIDTENDNGLSNWSPAEWQNHMAEFTVEYFLPDKANRRTCIDIGGNVGQMAIGLSPYFKEVHTFEPCPPFHNCLNNNLKEFNVTNVTSYNIGLSDKPSSLFYKMKYDRCGTSRFMTEEEIENGHHLVKPNSKFEFKSLEVNTLDSYNFQDVDLIKIDVEGWEPYVLAGGLETIKTWRPVVVAEWHNEIDPLEKIFNPMDYVLAYKRRSDFYYVPKEKVQWIMKNLFSGHPRASHHAFWKLFGI